MLRSLARAMSSVLVGPVERPDEPVERRRLVVEAPFWSVRCCAARPSFSASAVRPERSLDLVRLRVCRFFLGDLRFVEPDSLSAMAMACFRLLTGCSERPLLSSPFLYSCMTRSVLAF